MNQHNNQYDNYNSFQPFEGKELAKPNKPISQKILRVLITTSVVLALLLGLIFAGFWKFGNQSVFAKILDDSGQHEMSMIVDNLTGENTFSSLLSVNPEDPESCKKAWEVLQNKNLNFEKVAFKSLISAYPKNEEYQDEFRIETFFNNKIDTLTPQTEGKVDVRVKFDGDKVTQIVEEVMPKKVQPTTYDTYEESIEDTQYSTYSDEKYEKTELPISSTETNEEDYSAEPTVSEPEFNIPGKYDINVVGQFVVNSENLFFTIPEIGLKTDEFSSNNKLNNWYKQETGLDKTQREGVSELSEVFQEITQAKISEMFSQETVEEILNTSCSTIEKVEVQKATEVTFGEGDKQVTAFVRPIKVTMKENYQESASSNNLEIRKKIANDEVLKNFMKSRYELSTKFVKAYSKTTGANSETPSKEQYEKNIDENFERMKEAIVRQEEMLEKYPSMSESNEDVKVKTHFTYYLDTKTGMLRAVEGESYVQYLGSTFQRYSSLQDVIEDGIILKTVIYDLQYDDEVGEIIIPENSLPMNDFMKDIQTTDVFKKASELATPESQNTINNTNNTNNTKEEE